jgi:predicted NBD/HSP70 family sugar kinase
MGAKRSAAYRGLRFRLRANSSILHLVNGISLGIDIGGTTVKIGALREGEVLWTSRSARYSRPTIDQLVAAIRQASAQLTEPVERVGLCVPGLLNESKQEVTAATNVPGLVGVPLHELVGRGIESTTIAPVVVNDANATAYDIFSTRRPVGRLLVLAIGTGVGCSVLDDGKPLFVDGESPGHIGQVDVSVDNGRIIGPDGGRGGLEGYLGTAALRARYGTDPASKIRPGHVPFRALVRIIRICHAIYRPHHVCLAGGTGIRLGHLVQEIGQAVETDLTSVARKDWALFAAESDFHAAVGAARIAANGSWPG